MLYEDEMGFREEGLGDDAVPLLDPTYTMSPATRMALAPNLIAQAQQDLQRGDMVNYRVHLIQAVEMNPSLSPQVQQMLANPAGFQSPAQVMAPPQTIILQAPPQQQRREPRQKSGGFSIDSTTATIGGALLIAAAFFFGRK